MAATVKQTLTQLLQATPPQSAGAQLRANGSDTAASAFSQTLERKMSAPEQTSEAHTQRPQEKAKPQERQAVQPKQAEPEKPAESAAAPHDETAATSEPAPKDTREAAQKDTVEGKDETTATTRSDSTEATAVTVEAATPAELIAATPAVLAVEAANQAKPGTEVATASISLTDKPAGKEARVVDLTATVLSDDKAGTDGQTDLKGEVRADIGNGKSAAARDLSSDIKPGASIAREGAANFAEQLDQRLTAGVRPGEPLPSSTAAGQPVAGSTGAAAAMVAGTHMQPGIPAAVKAALPSHLGTPVHSPDWPDAVGNRVMWLAGKDESSAELILTPPSLGKLEISITVSGDTTTAHFTAATPAAREALEQAMPRLREMLEQAGVTLAESNVNTASQDQASGGGQQGHGRGNRHGGSADMAMNTVGTPAGHWIARGEGMIDIFA